MTCPFFLFFDTCQLLKFILIAVWAIANAYWPINFANMALGSVNKTSNFDDMVLFTQQIIFVLCWVIKSTKFCYDVTDICDP